MPSIRKTLSGILVNCSSLTNCLRSSCCVKTAVNEFTGHVTSTSFAVSEGAFRLRTGSKGGAGRNNFSNFRGGI